MKEGRTVRRNERKGKNNEGRKEIKEDKAGKADVRK